MINAKDVKRIYIDSKPLNYMFIDNNMWRTPLTALLTRTARYGLPSCVIEYDTEKVDEDLAAYLKSFGYEIEDDYEDSYGIRTLGVTWFFA